MRQNSFARIGFAVCVAALLGVGAAGSMKARAAGAPEYTWTLAALGQGGWIGGPLFEDGSVGGGGAFSSGNGRTIAVFRPTTWTESGDEITVCFDVVLRKGDPGSLPPSLCIPGEVTGTPVHIQLFGSDHIFRITELH